MERILSRLLTTSMTCQEIGSTGVLVFSLSFYFPPLRNRVRSSAQHQRAKQHETERNFFFFLMYILTSYFIKRDECEMKGYCAWSGTAMAKCERRFIREKDFLLLWVPARVAIVSPLSKLGKRRHWFFGFRSSFGCAPCKGAKKKKKAEHAWTRHTLEHRNDQKDDLTRFLIHACVTERKKRNI